MSTTDNAIQYDIKFVEHMAPYLELSRTQLKHLKDFVSIGLIQRDRVVELAISKVSGYSIVSIEGQDFCDGSDAKSVVSQSRNNDKKKGRWMNTFAIRRIRSKTGSLRIVAYNKLLDKFHYFFIPRSAYQHLKSVLEICIESYTSYNQEPTFTGVPDVSQKWWSYECETFEEMCMKRDPSEKQFDAMLATAEF
jgi:hypothetical protein